MNVPQIAERINELYSILKYSDSPDAIANKINSILLYGEEIPRPLLSAAWDLFAKQKRIKNELQS